MGTIMTISVITGQPRNKSLIGEVELEKEALLLLKKT